MSKLPPLCQTPTQRRIYCNLCKSFYSDIPSFDTVLLNKQNWCKSKYDIWVLQHKIPQWRGKQKQPFTFWYCVENFYPWKDIIGKKVSKIRSIAELGAFYGTAVPDRTGLLSQCCRTGRFILDPHFLPSQIPDLGSNNSKKEGGGGNLLPYLFCRYKFHKIEDYFFFEKVQKKVWANWQRI